MPGGYGFDASGSILVQCVPQDGSKSSWVLSSSDAESKLTDKCLSALVRLLLALLEQCRPQRSHAGSIVRSASNANPARARWNQQRS